MIEFLSGIVFGVLVMAMLQISRFNELEKERSIIMAKKKAKKKPAKKGM
jgi:hypothetical protein